MYTKATSNVLREKCWIKYPSCVWSYSYIMKYCSLVEQIEQNLALKLLVTLDVILNVMLQCIAVSCHIRH